MASDDWYRNTGWNDRIRDTFFDKLKRARSQRDQYLVIQALTLASDFPQVTIELVDLYFESRNDQFDDVRALLAKAEAYRSLGDLAETVRAYKEVLIREEEFPRHKTTTYVDLPYFVALESISEEYQFVLDILAKGVDDLRFPIDVFKWRAANALIAFELGQTDLASKHANSAVEVAEVRKSGFRYHQNVGLVGKEHQQVLKKLLSIAA